MKIACFSSYKERLKYLIAKANKFNDAEIYCVVFNYYYNKEDIENISKHNIKKLVLLTNLLFMKYDYEAFELGLAEYFKKNKPDLIITTSLKNDVEVCARLASKLDIPFLNYCLDFNIFENKLLAKKYSYEGLFILEYEAQLPAIISLIPEEKYDIVEGKAKEIEENMVKVNISRVLIRDIVKHETKFDELKNSKVIIAIGEEIRDKELLPKFEILAKILNGKLTSNKFALIKNGWFKEWIGFSCVNSSFDLIINFGVNEILDFIAPLINTKNVITITSNPENEVNNFSHYVVLANPNKLLYALIKELEAKKKV
jgi:electron transfer flavoprotein alpha subunit